MISMAPDQARRVIQTLTATRDAGRARAEEWRVRRLEEGRSGKKSSTYDATLVDQMEKDLRALKEKVLAGRLAAAEKAARTVGSPAAGASRARAGALAAVAREVRAVLRDLGRELRRQEAVADLGGLKVSEPLKDLHGKARDAARKTPQVVGPAVEEEDRERRMRRSARLSVVV